MQLWRMPRRHRVPDRERGWLAAANTFTLEVGRQQVRGWTWGTGGPPVVLLHGWEGRGAQLGAFASPLVEAGFRVIAIDAPGHGESSGRLSSMPQFVEALRALSRRFGDLHAIVAHSFGSAAAASAVHHGLEAKVLVFIAPPADLQEYVAFFGDLLELPQHIQRGLVTRLEQRFNLSWQAVRYSTLRPRAGVPVLVVHDRDDRDSPVVNGKQVAAAWPAARFFETSGLGHRRILRDETVVSEVVGFLAEVRTRAGIS